MSEAMVIGIMRDAFLTVLLVAGPVLIVALLVGLLVSIFQATTQIQEQTLTFVPKITAVFVVILILLPYFFGKLGNFSGRIFDNISNIIR